MNLHQKHFNGYDWTELARAWNVYIPDDFFMGIGFSYGFHPTCKDYDPIKWMIYGAIEGYDGIKSSRVMYKLAQDCREYLSLLGNEDTSNSYSAPVWLGMSKIKDDWTLLWFVYENIGSMWD